MDINICIICLSKKISKDIKLLNGVLKNDPKNGLEIMKFCLDVEINEDSMFTQLCLKCYRKLMLFYKFKMLAQKSNVHLMNQIRLSNLHSNNEIVKQELKTEPSCYSSDLTDLDQAELKNDFVEAHQIKEEIDMLDFTDCNVINDSENELLSVFQQNKTKLKDTEVKKRRRHLEAVPQTGTEQICDFCGKTVKNLKEHLRCHQPLLPRKVIHCKYCTKTFSNYSAHYKHNKTKHLGIKSKCDLCSKLVVDLRAHRRLVHESEKLPHRCTVCLKAFLSRSALEQHTSLHTRLTPYVCPECGKSFRLKFTMIQHRKQVHENIKSHLCQYCSKSFFKKYHLQNHLRIHTKEKPYQCGECGKCFTTSNTRKTHMMRHSGIKMFNCTLCDMSFFNNAALKTHMISHTKERTHECQYCGRLFGRSDHRRRHERTAHPATTIQAGS